MQGEVDSNQYGSSFTRTLKGNWFVNNGRKSDRRFYRGWILEEGGIFGIVYVNVSFLARLLI